MVGDYKISAQIADHDNWFICNGRAISRTDYSDLFSIIGTSFGAGDGETTFNIPDFRDKTMWGANGNLNSTLAAGLPNITGSLQPGGISGLTYSTGISSVSGCFASSASAGGNTMKSTGYSSANCIKTATFDASTSDQIYGNSTTVQPPAICVNVFILVR